MALKELDNLVRSGLLKTEPGDQNEFDGLVDSGRKRLLDAGKKDLSLESKFDLAYNAAHAFSLAAMRWHGYRPAKRFAVFQALEHTLKIKPEIWRILDKCHGSRNIIEYEGAFNVNERLLADLIKATRIVQEALTKLELIPQAKPKGTSVS
jgi:hypothetical protein